MASYLRTTRRKSFYLVRRPTAKIVENTLTNPVGQFSGKNSDTSWNFLVLEQHTVSQKGSVKAGCEHPEYIHVEKRAFPESTVRTY